MYFCFDYMRTIDILTTQNVTINYELADVKDRIFASILDIIFQSIGLVVLSVVLASPGILGEQIFLYFITLPVIFFYHLGFEIFMDGRTLGKKLLGIQVVKLTGTVPSINDYLMRWALRPIDIFFSLGSIAIMLVSSSEKGQRLGDIVANTTVIKTNSTQRIGLADILNIRTLENYTPTYPGARQFSEEEMLLLKEVMDKSIKYKNTAHDDALVEACYLVKERLGLEKLPSDKHLFVRTLIKDYVAMSR